MVTTLRPPPHMSPISRGKLSDVVADDAAIAARNKARQEVADHDGVSAKHPGASAGPEPDNAFDTALNIAEAPLSVAGLGVFMGIPLLNGIGRLTGWVGDKLNFNFMRRTGGTLQKPGIKLETTTLSDLGKSGWGATAGKVGRGVFDRVGSATQWASDKTGFGSWSASRKMGGVYRHLDQARGIAGINIDAVHETLRPHVRSMQETLAAAAHPGHVDMGSLQKIFSEFDAVKEALHATKTTIATGPAAKNIGKLGKHVGKAVTKFGEAGEVKNIGATIKSLPAEMGKQSLSHNLNYGTWVAGSGLSLVHTARTLMKRWHALKRMHAAVEGVAPEKVSTLGMLFGSVSAPIAEARKHLIKTFFAREAVETFGLGIALKGMRNRHMGGLMVGAQFMGSMAVDRVMGESLVSIYEPLEAAYAAGQKLPPEAYAALIGMSSKELELRGGADGAFAKEIAKQYAAENKSPAEVLKEVGNGKLTWRMHEIMRANEAARASHAPAISHVEKLKGTQIHRAVVGEHTDKVTREPAGQSQGPVV